MKVENHLATFPKLIGTERQHNTVETAEVRYVYQPIESLILVLVTNKHSNIVEDLETLRLFAKARERMRCLRSSYSVATITRELAPRRLHSSHAQMHACSADPIVAGTT